MHINRGLSLTFMLATLFGTVPMGIRVWLCFIACGLIGVMVGSCSIGDPDKDPKADVAFIPFGDPHIGPPRISLSGDNLYLNSQQRGLWVVDLTAENLEAEYIGHADTTTDVAASCLEPPCVGVTAFLDGPTWDALARLGAGGGVWRRETDSLEWINESERFAPGPYPRYFLALPNDAVIAYSSSAFLTQDKGDTWHRLPITGEFVYHTHNASKPAEVWLAGGTDRVPHFYRSLDGGVSWSPVEPPQEFVDAERLVESVAVVGSASASVFVTMGGEDCLVWRKTGDGDWHAIESGLDEFCLIRNFDSSPSSLVLYTQSGHVRASDDEGDTWREYEVPLDDGEIIREILWDPVRHQFYVSSSTGVYCIPSF